MKLLPLQIPPQTRTDSAFAGRGPGQVSDWLEELPRGNAQTFATSLRDALLEINRGPLHKIERYALMEQLRPVVSDACAMLTSRYRTLPLPLGEGDQDAADLVLQLYAELAAGFKACANEQLSAAEAGQEGASARLQLAIQRAMLALGRTLLESYRIYAPEPPLLWRDLHLLYRNSELARLQALPIEGTRDSDETALSIKQAYLRIAVLAMANPYHLMQGEAEELYRRIGRWVHFVQIRTAGAGEALGGQFIADLSSDLPARYAPKNSKLAAPGEPRVLVLDRLIEGICRQIEHSNDLLRGSRSTSTLSERLQRDMYMRFRDAIGGRGERLEERRPTIARLTLVEGLSACHFFLNGRRPFTPEQDEAAWEERLGTAREDRGLKLLDDLELEGSSTPSKGLGRTSQFKGHDFEADDIWQRANLLTTPKEGVRRLRRSRYQAMSWNRKNESSGGMALFCPQNCPAQVRVGEVVTYASAETCDPPDWRVGTVRWLRTRPNGGLELGIKHLADNGYAVGTQAVSGTGKGAEYLRSIVLPRVNPLVVKTATLITPAAVYDTGSVLRLNMGELVIHVKLMEIIETTRLFTHFRFQAVQAPQAAKAPAKPSGDRRF